MAKKQTQPKRTNNEIRRLMLQYFYDRNANATSARGKKGSAVKISDIKKELREDSGLTQQEVQSNLTYLMSQGWIEEEAVERLYRTPGGTQRTTSTSFYKITAEGIDKIEGTGEFTMPKFQGININATGQNIITLGDGNQIDAQFSELGEALVELRDAVTKAGVSEQEKLTLVADIDTIESQLAKPKPNRRIIGAAWESVKRASTIDGCADLITKIAGFITGTLT